MSESLAYAIERLTDDVVDRLVASASKALRKAGLNARVHAEKRDDIYRLKVRSGGLTEKEHRRAEKIANAVIVSTMLKSLVETLH